METLQSLFPTAEELLATPLDDLAPVLLRLASSRLQAAGFIPEAVTEVMIGTGMAATADNGYPFHKKAQVDTLLSRAWNWLERNGYIEPRSCGQT